MRAKYFFSYLLPFFNGTNGVNLLIYYYLGSIKSLLKFVSFILLRISKSLFSFNLISYHATWLNDIHFSIIRFGFQIAGHACASRPSPALLLPTTRWVCPCRTTHRRRPTWTPSRPRQQPRPRMHRPKLRPHKPPPISTLPQPDFRRRRPTVTPTRRWTLTRHPLPSFLLR